MARRPRKQKPETQGGMNLMELMERHHSDDACREVLEQLRWPNGIACPRCGSLHARNTRSRHQYDCADCGYQFSVTSGTMLHDTHLPLRKWFVAAYLMCESKKGISANQLKHIIDVSYKTAWYLEHRIRDAMAQARADAPKLSDIIEVDETKGHGYKQSIIGAFHHVSVKHLDKYLDEIEWRHSGRQNSHIFRDTLRELVKAEHMEYQELVS